MLPAAGCADRYRSAPVRAELPFGGVGMDEFVNKKLIRIVS